MRVERNCHQCSDQLAMYGELPHNRAILSCLRSSSHWVLVFTHWQMEIPPSDFFKAIRGGNPPPPQTLQLPVIAEKSHLCIHSSTILRHARWLTSQGICHLLHSVWSLSGLFTEALNWLQLAEWKLYFYICTQRAAVTLQCILQYFEHNLQHPNMLIRG